jgi:predicted RNA-binding protein with PUA-like domain
VRPVTLVEIKNQAELQQLLLVRNARLSVMPVSFDEFSAILRMGNTQL